MPVAAEAEVERDGMEDHASYQDSYSAGEFVLVAAVGHTAPAPSFVIQKTVMRP